MNPRLTAENISVRFGRNTVFSDLSFTLSAGELLVIIGSSGSGKTTLGRLLVGQLAPDSGSVTVSPGTKRLMIEQQDHFFSLAGQRSTYYGQRYENQGMENCPTVKEFLQKQIRGTAGADIPVCANTGNGTIDEPSRFIAPEIKNETGMPHPRFEGRLESLPRDISNALHQMNIENIADRKLLQLSNGERKRTQLAAALLQQPDLLILDQPFVGLDVQSRTNLQTQLAGLKNSGVTIVIICDIESIPADADAVLELNAGKIVQLVSPEKFNAQAGVPAPHLRRESCGADIPVCPAQAGMPAPPAQPDEQLFELLPPVPENFKTIVGMKNVSVQLNGKQILRNINWTVRAGEQWALTGHNGAGKTTLLSLITADNPQGYANELVLFDRRRGSGESIWEIKKRIGFVAPELHLYFLRGSGIFNTVPGLDGAAHKAHDSLTCIDVITSGFRDEIGFSSPADDHQLYIAQTWLSIFELEPLRNRLFIQTSLGEQRSLLLARALVKSPALLILDEPCQGLDAAQTRRFIALLDAVCRKLNTTMIYVSHRREEIPACVTKQLILKDGRSVQ
ncbi:MAG: ATP-binding cassette domain-containing protein [Kiritimatiellales bacterium]